MNPTFAIALASLAAAAGPAAAQTANPLGGLLGGSVPSIASVGIGNAAGLLGYCVKNNLLAGGNAGSVLGKLTGRSGVATSPGFAAGQQGTVQSGRSQLSLDSIGGQLKTQLCNQVLKRAQSFL